MNMKLALCTTGLPGSGKGVFKEGAERLGIPTYVMGDYVRREAEKKYGKVDSMTTGDTMIYLREKFGRDIIAKLVADDIENDGHNIFLIDGIRNMEELEHFKGRGWEVILISVLASRETRYKRLVNRGRVDDIKDISEFMMREDREKSIGLNRIIDIADYYFYNEDMDQAEAIEKAVELLRHIISVAGVKDWEGRNV